jgi:hypothetical protein
MLSSGDGILQTNATVTAGVLILLTVTSIGSGSGRISEVIDRVFTLTLTLIIIVPFAVSSAYILLATVADKWSEAEKEKKVKTAARFTMAGFIYLIAIIAFIIILNATFYEETV